MATTTRGASRTSSPPVKSWKRRSVSRLATSFSWFARAIAVLTHMWLTRKNAIPAAKAPLRSAGTNGPGVKKASPVSRQNVPRAAANASVYWAVLNSGRLQCFLRRQSSTTIGRAWASTTSPIGAMSSSATAKVVEIVISSLDRP